MITLPLEVESVELIILCENTTFRSNIYGDAGLAILINATLSNGDTIKILFDTGENEEVFIHNIEVLNVDLSDLDVIVISHGHHDHTGGLIRALDMVNRRIPIILHPDALLPKFALKPKLRYTGIPFDPSEIERRGILLFSRRPINLSDSIIVSGEIPRKTDYEKVENYYILRQDRLEKDYMLDDQALFFIFADNSIGIITGCSHSGIINITNYSQEITQKRSVKFIIGGFHLINASDKRIEKTWEDLSKIDPAYLSPMHCSGVKIISKILQNNPKKYLAIHAGDRILFKTT